MTVNESSAILASDVCIKIVFVCKDFALIVVHSDGIGLTDLSLDEIIYAPCLQQSGGVWCELQPGTNLKRSACVSDADTADILQRALEHLLAQ